ncbi:hypothetical protein R5R35_005354 [Gryllus longicercus]|uniref:G-protein coupled receptors family 2 profile 2 domain-containing protein n=1 Tax=Gryllus longicercus TaxID=2509291 RepID=A0AAN9VR28_9ORTH
MRTLCALLLVTLARAEVTFYATKCCGAFEMLAGDGQSCVVAPWPRNYTLQLQQRSDLTAIELQPGVLPWVRHWMPPGLSLDRKADAYLSYLPRLRAKSSVRAVAEATQWDERRAEAEGAAYWRRRVVFTKYGGAVRRESFHAVTATVRSFACCVDAARPPLAPFALVVEKDCDVDECASKCCEEGKVAEAKGEGWKCREDARGNWSPDTSSFARFLPADLPLERRRGLKCGSAPKRGLRLTPGDAREAYLLRRRYHNFLFSSWGTCVDFERRGNESSGEILIYCEVSRITRGVYWMLRPLCFLSGSLLVVALLSVVCDSGMRRKAHGWCLACHAVCLLAFNLGQMAYYLLISDEIDGFGYVAFHLKKICTRFALSMYFVSMAANCWLTALCFNMTLGFGKLQMARPGSGDRWRFVGLSIFAWGLPALMLALCSHAFESDAKSQKWFSPSLMETRTCFNELAYTKLKINAICIARTLRRVQFLRRGNSVLHRDDDKVRLTEAGLPRADNARNRGGVRSAVADAKTIRLYVKMLLMTGLVEMLAETLAWITKIYSEREHFSFEDHALSYRATGFVADCFRAGCVAWLAAPEGGYFGALRSLLGGGGREGARKKRAFS